MGGCAGTGGGGGRKLGRELIQDLGVVSHAGGPIVKFGLVDRTL